MKTFTKVWLGIAFLAIGIGTAILIIAVASGVSIKDIPTFSYEETYNDVIDINMDIDYGEVHIMEGESFSIDAQRLPENSLESYVDGKGTWIIQQSFEKRGFINIFGVHVPFGDIIGWDEVLTPKITITIPKDFAANNFVVVVKAGEVVVDRIQANTGSFDVSAGRLVVNELSIAEKSEYIIGAGQMLLNKVTLKDITVDCGIGDVTIRGEVSGNSEITCGVGNVELELDSDEADYSYDISASIGDVRIGDNSYQNMSNRIINNNSAENSLSLNCEIGKISVDFY